MAAIENKSRSASAQAVETTQLLIIPKTAFKRLLLADANICFTLLKRVSERLRRADEEIENLLFRNILGRVSKTLYDLSSARGQKLEGGTLLKDHYTHQELADLVGTTREPLSRALAMLRRADLLATRGGNMFLPNPKRLETLIDSSVGPA